MVGGLWTVSAIFNAPDIILAFLLSYLNSFGCFDLIVPFHFVFYFAVFHVTDLNGNKLTDESVINYIEQVNKSFFLSFILIVFTSLNYETNCIVFHACGFYSH